MDRHRTLARRRRQGAAKRAKVAKGQDDEPAPLS
jgi:hypothetical protein